MLADPQSVPWLPPSAFARSAPEDAPLFSMQTRWDYPVEFYNQPQKPWPALSFVASVNVEMGAFGGVIAIVDGEVNNAVRDYETRYDRRAHARDVRASLRRVRSSLPTGHGV